MVAVPPYTKEALGARSDSRLCIDYMILFDLNLADSSYGAELAIATELIAQRSIRCRKWLGRELETHKSKALADNNFND